MAPSPPRGDTERLRDAEGAVAQRAEVARSLGVVVIGRNEGERLRRCLDSVAGQRTAVVYVDSGSTDGSQELAREKGAHVVELDLSIPFTAARARNAGFERLIADRPDLRHVQFVDGDCEMVAGWLERAHRELEARPDVAVVCGRRRERFPERSVYNRLCDLEWDTPVGEADSCGGDALYRAGPFQQVGGFDPKLIAGEEPELCFRLRSEGYKILRVDAEMTIHDAAMTRFSQWWKRTKRAGHAAAESAWMHRSKGERRYSKVIRSAVFWAGVAPLSTLAGLGIALYSGSAGWAVVIPALFLAANSAMVLRVYRGRGRHGDGARDSLTYAVACMVGKYPELAGILLFASNRLRRRQAKLIEY